MNYNQSLEYLQNLTRLGWKLGLNKIRSLLSELDNPHEKYKVVHVAGTNGKGSTSTMLASILKEAGYHTGLFTSPHLVYIGERIKINGNPISKKDFVRYIETLQPLIKKYKCTFFEAITAIALVYFADQKVDIAVIEVGLGGRLDATNVVNSAISIITNINFDHTRLLGNNRKSIAREKGGIIKSNSICITNCTHKSANDTIAEICSDKNVEHIRVDKLIKVDRIRFSEHVTTVDMGINGSFYPRLRLGLLGEHQIDNAALAVTAANIINSRIFPIKADHIYDGLLNVYWPARIQVLETCPKIVADVAHNPNGMTYLKKSIQEIFKFRRLILLMGVAKDKDYERMIKKIAPITDEFVAVRAENHRSLEAHLLGETALKYIPVVHSFPRVKDGLEYVISNATDEDLVLCTGSHYTVGEIFQELEKHD